MLRYRVAIMLVMFYLLAIALEGKLVTISFLYVLGAAALLSSYVAATTINDLIDKDIDKINHPHSAGRPLVSGEATEKDLYFVHGLALFLSFVCSFYISWNAVLILAVSFLINYIYSAPPFKISHRTLFAPLLLSVAYVGVPFVLGIETASGSLSNLSVRTTFLLSLMVIFLGRIMLKDFRDRKGDAQYGKPTFLLHYGKPATCFVSFTTIFLGNIVLFISLSTLLFPILIILEFFFIAIYIALFYLYRAPLEDEQVYIGLGAKMGNGFLVSLLGLFILLTEKSPFFVQIGWVFLTVVLFGASFFMILKTPHKALNAYKG